MKKKTTPEKFNPINSEIAQKWYKETFADLKVDQAIALMFPKQPKVKVWLIDKVNRTITFKMEDLNKEAWKHLIRASQAIREKKLKEKSNPKNND